MATNIEDERREGVRPESELPGGDLTSKAKRRSPGKSLTGASTTCRSQSTWVKVSSSSRTRPPPDNSRARLRATGRKPSVGLPELVVDNLDLGVRSSRDLRQVRSAVVSERRCIDQRHVDLEQRPEDRPPTAADSHIRHVVTSAATRSATLARASPGLQSATSKGGPRRFAPP